MTKLKKGVQEIDTSPDFYVTPSGSDTRGGVNCGLSFVQSAIVSMHSITHCHHGNPIEQNKTSVDDELSSISKMHVGFPETNQDRASQIIQKINDLYLDSLTIGSTAQYSRKQPIALGAGEIECNVVFDEKRTFLFLPLKKINDQKTTNRPVIR